MPSFLNEFESKKQLQKFGLPTGDFVLAKSAEEAVSAAEKLRYPVVMKIVSDQIIHKTEAKGIKLNLPDAESVKSAFEEILKNAVAYDKDAQLEGVLVSSMVPSGTECIIGGLQDQQFGPVIMFGLGGIFVEIFRDVKFRMAPIDELEAERMIRSIKAFPLLDGARGREKVNIKALAQVLAQVSHFLDENRDVKELDINPIVCYGQDVCILDASIGYSK